MHIISSSRRSSSWALVVPFAGIKVIDMFVNLLPVWN